MFPGVRQLEKSSMKFANYLLDQAKVLVAPGIFYIGNGHMRVTFLGIRQTTFRERNA